MWWFVDTEAKRKKNATQGRESCRGGCLTNPNARDQENWLCEAGRRKSLVDWHRPSPNPVRGLPFVRYFCFFPPLSVLSRPPIHRSTSAGRGGLDLSTSTETVSLVSANYAHTIVRLESCGLDQTRGAIGPRFQHGAQSRSGI